MVVVYKKLGVVMEDHMEYCVAWMYVDTIQLFNYVSSMLGSGNNILLIFC